ncbi:MAG TPA: hypothetical protein IAA27_10750 [Candidatus Enterococcus stercoravium]|nr:hypothetical protein [Candidatus Enterococcus stercoravium]
MKKRSGVILLVAIFLGISTSVGFYSYSSYADEQDYQAQVARERKEADLLFVEHLILKTSKHKRITAAELATLTRGDRIGTVTKLEVDQLTDLQELVPGTYKMNLTIQMPSNVVIHRSANVSVIDDVAPIITVAKELVVESGVAFPLEAVTASDDTGGKLALANLTIKGYDRQKVGEQKVMIEARDQAGNLATKQVIVTVMEKTPKAPAVEAKTDQDTQRTSEETATAKETEATTRASTDEAGASAKVEESTASKAIATTESSVSASQWQNDGNSGLAQEVSSESVEESAAEPPTSESEATTATPASSEEKVGSRPESTVVASSLQFAGVSIPFVQSQGVGAAPATGAGAWLGTGNTTDGAPTHFIGHNPGDFSAVMSLGVGAVITVTDGNGNARSYTVYEVIDVTDDGYNNNDLTDDVYPRMLDAGGERISLQTCITDTVNRCVLAR